MFKSLITGMLIVLFLAFGSGGLKAQKFSTQIVDVFLTSCFSEGVFNGTALISVGDQIVYTKGFGLANREWGIQNTSSTRFDIGSLTKQFVVVLTFQLIEEGLLSWNDPITKFIPEYRKDIGDIVTIDHLLKHTSGIKPYVEVPGIDNYLARPLTSEEALGVLHSQDLEFSPGERYQYNNTGFCLLVYIIEDVTGETFKMNLDHRILKPLEMNNTGLVDSREIIPDLASGYVLELGGYKKPKYLNPNNTYGAGGMYSTVTDMFLFNRALINNILLPDSYDSLMFLPYFEYHPGNGHAYGWNITTLKDRNTGSNIAFASYNGAQWGYLCEVSWLFEQDILIELFTNFGHTIDIWSIENGLRNIIMNKTFKQPKKCLSSELYKSIYTHDFNEIVSDLSMSPRETGSEYSISEYRLNTLGYKLLWRKEFDKSEMIFKLITKLFPSSANAFDSLGEYLFKYW